MTSEGISKKIQECIPLAPLTTMRVGGNADYFLDCNSVDEVRSALHFAANSKIPVYILGGGSNTLFPDEGFRGLVIKISIRGMDFQKNRDGAVASVMSGEIFDDFVRSAVELNMSGVECLSGIPGTAGASPVQNVGAYGQEVGDTILFVEAMDRLTGDIKIFSRNECGFLYRSSNFKREWKDRYVIVRLQFSLSKYGRGFLKYQELNALVSEKYGEDPSPGDVRNSVLHLRKKKSMVLDPHDPDSISCGSFFMNPYVTKDHISIIEKSLGEMGESVDRLPIFNVSDGYKISAAYLIERAGFSKGFVKNGAGISASHALALVNRGCGRKEILALAEEIREGVFSRFGVRLEMEPVVVGES